MGEGTTLIPTAAAEEHEEVVWYVRQIAAYPPLNLKQERALIACLADSDCNQQALREQLIEGTLMLVVRQARTYRGLGIPLVELIAQGNLALVKAARSFLPAPRHHFRHYSARCVHLALFGMVVEYTHPGGAPLTHNQ